MLNATEKPRKTNPRVFSILRFLFSKHASSVHCITSKPKLTGRRTHICPFLCLYILVREYQCNIWPCTNSPSTAVPAVMHILQHCAGGQGQKEEFAIFAHRNRVAFFAWAYWTGRLLDFCISKSHYYKNEKITCGRVWWIFYLNEITLHSWVKYLLKNSCSLLILSKIQ